MVGTKTFTEVRYDVSQAEKDLQKLDRQVVKSGRTAERSFGQVGTDGVRKFGDALDVINPKIIALGIGLTKVGKGFRKFAKFAVQGSLIIGGLVVVSKVISATVANVANLADKLADIDARIGAINETTERTLRLRNLASSIGDANDNRQFIELKRILDLKEAESAFRENEGGAFGHPRQRQTGGAAARRLYAWNRFQAGQAAALG